MKLSRLLSVSLALIGGWVAGRVLARRHRWERTHNRVAICVDYDDARTAAIRAGIAFDEMLAQLASHGATHVSLPELTLNRLRALGQLTPRVPARPRKRPPRVGHWNYMHGNPELVAQLAANLVARLPYTHAAALSGGTLVFAGDLPTIGEIGLGFDPAAAAQVAACGLGLVPRPVSYAWPEKALIDQTLAQAALLGEFIAFDGNVILGHEMHLDETLTALARHGLTFVYFAESRHQKGDWFVAKRRAPYVILGHRFTAEEMIPLDYHAAAHHWAYLARERGVRFCYVDFFKVLHATEPLEGLHYIEHIQSALEREGFEVTAQAGLQTPVPTPTKRELALTGLVPAGIAATAATAVLDLPETAAVPIAALAASGAAALPYLEQPRTRLEAQYPPSYAPKALALATASLAPVAALALVGARAERAGIAGWGTGLVLDATAAACLAALTSGHEYQLRIEEYRGLNLDWLLPLAVAAREIPGRYVRMATLAFLAGAWYLAYRNQLDPLARLDPAHAEGHTHHLSAAARLLGDARIALGPQPARKWTGLGAFGTALSAALAGRGQPGWSAGAAMVAAVGHALALVGWRRPERALPVTARTALPSFGLGVGSGLLALLLLRQADG